MCLPQADTVDTVSERDMVDDSAETRKKPRYILMGGITADLREMYKTPMNHTFNIFLKKGNFRFVAYEPRSSAASGVLGSITINVQKQLERLGVTYKPCNTHITAARICDDTGKETAQRWCNLLAAHLGNRDWSITLSAYGSHSVRITGELEQAIRTELSSITGNPWSGCIPNPIHVELRPQLKENEKYVEIDAFSSLVKCTGCNVHLISALHDTTGTCQTYCQDCLTFLWRHQHVADDSDEQ